MSRIRLLIGVIGTTAAMAGMTVAGGSASAAAFTRPPVTPLAGSVAPFTSQVWLRPRLAAAQSFAMAVSTPGSRLFHHYLSPDGYSARFGAARGEASKIESWLRAEGFTGVHADSQRSYVRATASASRIDDAFQVRLRLYKSSRTSTPERTGCARTTGPSPFLPRSPVACLASRAWTTPRQFSRSHGRVACLPAVWRDGMFLTLHDYAKVMRIPAPSPSRYAELSIGRGSDCGDLGNIEEQLDVESSYDVATSAAAVPAWSGPSLATRSTWCRRP